MRDYGLADEMKINHVNISSLEKTGAKAIDKALADGCEAIICATNSITVMCLRHLNRLKKNVPEDVRIMGFDGGSEFDFYNAPISFMTQPTETIAKKSVDILINQLQSNEGIITQIEIEGTIVEHTPAN